MLKKWLLIAWRKYIYSIFRGEEEMMEWKRETETRMGRVHHRSVVAGLNQLLTPCRLAAMPTNDAMKAVSFPRSAAHLRENDRMRCRKENSIDDKWTGGGGANFFCGLFISVGETKESQDYMSEWGPWCWPEKRWSSRHQLLLWLEFSLV